MGKIVELKEGNFDDFISKGNCVIDFWAEWCGPCKILIPVVDELAKEMKGKIKFGKVNVDKESEIAQRFEVMSIPTLIFFKSGEIVNRKTGAVPKDDLEDEINEAFGL